MITRAISHKFGALAAAFANVIVAAKILPESASVLYLSGLSLVQIVAIFGGFGATQKLVRVDDAPEHISAIVWPVLTTVALGILGLVALGYNSGSTLAAAITTLNASTLLLLNAAEVLRCATSRQIGYVISIVATATVAAAMFWVGTIATWFAIIPLFGLLMCVAAYPRLGRRKSVQWPSLKDVVKALRVLSVNQAYNLVVVLIGLVFPTPETALMLVLVYRFNIFFNWQSFYWLRFGHREMNGAPTEDHRRRSRRFSFLNLAAFVALLTLIAAVHAFDLDALINETTFDRSFLELLAIYAAMRVLFNFTFPYEIYSVYSAKYREDVWFLLVVFAGLLIVSGLAYADAQAVLFLIAVEAVWVLWRVACWRTQTGKREQ